MFSDGEEGNDFAASGSWVVAIANHIHEWDSGFTLPHAISNIASYLTTLYPKTHQKDPLMSVTSKICFFCLSQELSHRKDVIQQVLVLPAWCVVSLNGSQYLRNGTQNHPKDAEPAATETWRRWCLSVISWQSSTWRQATQERCPGAEKAAETTGWRNGLRYRLHKQDSSTIAFGVLKNPLAVVNYFRYTGICLYWTTYSMSLTKLW